MSATQPRPPSGAQHTIRHGDQVAVVTEVGATLRRYDVGARTVLDGFQESSMADGGRGQVLAPWPNRVPDGRWEWDGRPLQLSLSEAANHNAIHGLVRWSGWSLAGSDGAAAVTLETTLWPTPGYPFLLTLGATYRLGDGGLTVELRARNDGAEPAPYGVGQHPYVTAGADVVDGWRLSVPAETRLLTDERGNAAGRDDVAGSAFDFREPRTIGDLELDTAYTGLVPDHDGRVRVRLEGTDGGVEVWAGAGVRWLQVFTGDTLSADRRRRGVAVEPMSCPPGALASGEDLVLLAPGEEHLLSWGIDTW